MENEKNVDPIKLFIGDYFTHTRSELRFVVVGIHQRRDGFSVRNSVELEIAPEDPINLIRD